MRKSETLFCSLRDFPSVKIYEFKASIFIQSYVQQYLKNKNKIEIVGSAIKLHNYFIGGNFKNAVGIFVGGEKSLLLSIFESETKKT